MAYGDTPGWTDRSLSASGAALITMLVGAALLNGFAPGSSLSAGNAITVFSVAIETPPTPQPAPAPRANRAPDPEGAAAPPNRRATATQIVAPIPRIRIEREPPVNAAVVAGLGNDTDQGAAELPGPGTGAGGAGTGTGSGNAGVGTGGGGGGSRARWARGRIDNDDYPNGASRANVGGSVSVRFTVGTDGRVSDCRVMQTSGNGELDRTTCALIERRFHYQPARDANGQPTTDVMGWRQDWWLEPRGR